MKLPKRGCYVDPTTGDVKWSWDTGHPDKEFDALPPRALVFAADGTITGSSVLGEPDWHIVDLEAIFPPGGMIEFHQNMHRIRIRVTADKGVQHHEVVLVFDKGLPHESEIPHPAFSRLKKGPQ